MKQVNVVKNCFKIQKRSIIFIPHELGLSAIFRVVMRVFSRLGGSAHFASWSEK